MATPPTLTTRILKTVGEEFCNVSKGNINEDTLSTKRIKQQAIGSSKSARKVISSKRVKGKEKMVDEEPQEPSKKTKN